MAIDRRKYQILKHGIGHDAALYLSNGTLSPQKAVTVAAPTAIGSVVAAGANPTKAEYDTLRTDVINLRTTVAALLTSLKNAGSVA